MKATKKSVWSVQFVCTDLSVYTPSATNSTLLLDKWNTHTHTLLFPSLLGPLFCSAHDCGENSTLSYEHTIELYLTEQCVAELLVYHLTHTHAHTLSGILLQGRAWLSVTSTCMYTLLLIYVHKSGDFAQSHVRKQRKIRFLSFWRWFNASDSKLCNVDCAVLCLAWLKVQWINFFVIL